MAERKCFIYHQDKENIVEEKLIEFKYYNGFAMSQKQKCIESLHNEISIQYPDRNILEVSTKSQNILGVKLSAFNLQYKIKTEKYFVENIFQSSKVFEKGGPFIDILAKTGKDAKRDDRIKSNGDLIKFSWENIDWGLEPKTMFYDWIYINALYQNKDLHEEVLKYDIFTDIEFNHKKSFNCQAKSVALFVGLYKSDEIEHILKSKENYIEWISNSSIEGEQLNIFDL